MIAVTTTQAIPAVEDRSGSGSGQPTLDRQVVRWLRLEGVAALVAGTVAYATLGGSWIWFLPALLLVDASAVGYLANPRLGAFTYDLAHNWALGLAILGLGLALSLPVVALAGTVVIAHIGLDRSVGYGLKLGSGFKDTHLGRIGR
jgi:Domain of unknown function (DUF4260)